jgi:hypothetical protein
MGGGGSRTDDGILTKGIAARVPPQRNPDLIAALSKADEK